MISDSLFVQFVSRGQCSSVSDLPALCRAVGRGRVSAFQGLGLSLCVLRSAFCVLSFEWNSWFVEFMVRFYPRISTNEARMNTDNSCPGEAAFRINSDSLIVIRGIRDSIREIRGS